MAKVNELRVRNGQVLKCTEVVVGTGSETFVRYKRLSRPNGDGGEIEQRRWDKLEVAGMLRTELEGTLAEQNLQLASAIDALTERVLELERHDIYFEGRLPTTPKLSQEGRI